MPVTRRLPPIPDANVPVIDLNGQMTDAWRRFFIELLVVLEEMRGLIP